MGPVGDFLDGKVDLGSPIFPSNTEWWDLSNRPPADSKLRSRSCWSVDQYGSFFRRFPWMFFSNCEWFFWRLCQFLRTSGSFADCTPAPSRGSSGTSGTSGTTMDVARGGLGLERCELWIQSFEFFKWHAMAATNLGVGGCLRCSKMFMYFAGWWFQIFLIFTPTQGRFPIWPIFFRWLETTN